MPSVRHRFEPVNDQARGGQCTRCSAAARRQAIFTKRRQLYNPRLGMDNYLITNFRCVFVLSVSNIRLISFFYLFASDFQRYFQDRISFSPFNILHYSSATFAFIPAFDPIVLTYFTAVDFKEACSHVKIQFLVFRAEQPEDVTCWNIRIARIILHIPLPTIAFDVYF